MDKTATSIMREAGSFLCKRMGGGQEEEEETEGVCAVAAAVEEAGLLVPTTV